jgi:hypothetical protein
MNWTIKNGGEKIHEGKLIVLLIAAPPSAIGHIHLIKQHQTSSIITDHSNINQRASTNNHHHHHKTQRVL